MTQEQPATLRVPPSRWYSKLPPKPKPDYHSNSWRSDLPTAPIGGKKLSKKYLKGLYPKLSEPIRDTPTKKQLKGKHKGRKNLNAPPADASGQWKLIKSQPARHRKRKAPKKRELFV